MSNKKKRISQTTIFMVLLLVIIVIVAIGELIYFRTREKGKLNAALSAEIISNKAGIEKDKAFLQYAEEAVLKENERKSKKEADFLRLESDTFKNAQVSMWDLEIISSEWYENFFAENLANSEYVIDSPQELKEYLVEIIATQPGINHIYMALDPYKLRDNYYKADYYNLETLTYEEYLQEEFYPVIENNPQISFVIILPVISTEYLSSLSDDIVEDMISEWYLFAMNLRWYSNASVRYIGDREWLVVNPDNFKSSNELTDDMTTLAYAYLYAFEEYEITPPEIQYAGDTLLNLLIKINNGDYSYPLLEDKKVVLFGDNILCQGERYSVTIAGYLKGLTGADITDLSKSGCGACKDNDNCFNAQLEAFLSGDAHEAKVDYFVVEYGLNDYLNGCDVSHFGESLREGIQRIKKEYPDAGIILVTPYTPGICDGGNRPINDKGEVLHDFVLEMSEAGIDENVAFLNLYDRSGITEENSYDFLSDGIHPNVNTSMYFAKLIASALEE